MSALIQDLRYACRQLWKDKSVALVVVITIALGIGVNTAVFSMINGFDRPLPVKNPGEIVVLAADTKGDETGLQFNFSYAALQDLRRQTDSFTDVFAYTLGISGFSLGDKASQFAHAAVTGNYFTALGIRPQLGRFFEPGEGEGRGEELNVVLGHSFWQTKFGGDPGVIGKQVRIDGASVTIIGVAPKSFRGVYAGIEMDGYLPLRSQISDEYGWTRDFFTGRKHRSLTVLGRLKPGVTLKQAQASTSAAAEHPDSKCCLFY